MRARTLGGTGAAVAACLAVGVPPAQAAPEQVTRAEVRWDLGERLDARLERSCVRPRATGGRYTDATWSRNGAATGTVDAEARTAGVTLGAGTLRFAKTRRAARSVRSLTLGRLGVELSGEGGYLVARVGGRTQRVASIGRPTHGSGPLVQRGRATPNTFRHTLSATARALAPLTRLASARCRGGRARARIRRGTAVGTVSVSWSPPRATGLAGGVGLRLFLNAPRDPVTGQLFAIDTLPIAPAESDGEGVTLPVTGSAPLVRGTGDAFVPAGPVATTAGVAFAVGAARVEVRDIALGYSATGRLEGLTATVAGVRRPLAVLGADGSLTGEPGAMAQIAAGLGLASVSVVSAAADAGFTRTGPA